MRLNFFGSQYLAKKYRQNLKNLLLLQKGFFLTIQATDY